MKSRGEVGAGEINYLKGTVTQDSRFARSPNNVEKKLWREVLIQIGIRQWAH
jgi:hypothetical protein